jgi:hypothetical protein
LVRGLCQRPRLTRHFFWPRLPWLLLAAFPLLTSAASQPHLSDYIRPFVGTQGEGNTYPGPSAPFGMIQLGPDTDRDLWDTASGYEYTDTSIMGFPQSEQASIMTDLQHFLSGKRFKLIWSHACLVSALCNLPFAICHRLSAIGHWPSNLIAPSHGTGNTVL